MIKSQKIVWIHIQLIVLFSLSSLCIAGSDIRFGSVAMDTPAVMDKRLSPLTKYLSDTLGRNVVLKLSPNMPAAIKDVSNKKVELAYLTPVAYIKSHQKGGTRLVVKTVTNNKASFQLMIVVREDSGINSVEELKGNRFAFGDKAALLQRAAVVGSGLKLEDFEKYDFLGHYDNIARGVLNKDYTAGILKDTKAFKWEGKGLKIIYKSPHLPPYNIAVSSKVDDALLAKLKSAFLNLDVKNPQHRKVIKALSKKYDGFAPTSDEEYDVIRELVKPFK